MFSLCGWRFPAFLNIARIIYCDFQDASDEEYSPSKRGKNAPAKKGKGGKKNKKKGSDSDSDEDWAKTSRKSSGGGGGGGGAKKGGVSVLLHFLCISLTKCLKFFHI